MRECIPAKGCIWSERSWRFVLPKSFKLVFPAFPVLSEEEEARLYAEDQQWTAAQLAAETQSLIEGFFGGEIDGNDTSPSLYKSTIKGERRYKSDLSRARRRESKRERALVALSFLKEHSKCLTQETAAKLHEAGRILQISRGAFQSLNRSEQRHVSKTAQWAFECRSVLQRRLKQHATHKGSTKIPRPKPSTTGI